MSPRVAPSKGSRAILGNRQRSISTVLYALGLGAMLMVICIRYLKDGSFWLDEASVALSFRDLELSEVFDRLLGSQSFPRWYFLLVKAASEVFGYETHVLRFFPMIFAMSGTVLTLRLLWVRFGGLPVVFGVAILLNLIPTSWFTYAAFIKQYTFDVLLALLPFCLPDAFFERHWRQGKHPIRLALLALPCALSYTYVIPLLGRLLGFWGMTGIGGRRPAVDLRATGLLVASIAAFLGCLWWTDLRFTVGQQAVTEFHSDYIVGVDWSRTPRLLQRLTTGWYTGSMEFGVARGLPRRMLELLQLLAAIGVLRIAWDGLGKGRAAPEAPAIWGSRSLGSLATVCGLILASPIMSYPIAEGRMTLFALLHVQMLILEGLSWGLVQIDRKRSARLAKVPIAMLVGLAIALMMFPAAWRNATGIALRDPPSNMRGVLPKIQQHRDLPLLVTFCSHKQVESLPEGIGVPDVRYLDLLPDYEHDLPLGQPFLMLDVGESYPCRRYLRTVAKVAARERRLSSDHDSAELWWFELPSEFPEWAREINRRTHERVREQREQTGRDPAGSDAR